MTTADQSVADLWRRVMSTSFWPMAAIIKPIATGSDGSGLEIAGPALSIGGGVGVGLRKEDTDLKAKFDAAIKVR